MYSSKSALSLPRAFHFYSAHALSLPVPRQAPRASDDYLAEPTAAVYRSEDQHARGLLQQTLAQLLAHGVGAQVLATQ